MAAVRRLAVERYSAARWLGRLSNQWQGSLWLFLGAAILLRGVIAVGGSFSPQIQPVRYASMLPHVTLNVFFGAVAAAAVVAAVIGMARAWKAFTDEPLWEADPRRFLDSLVPVVREIAAHRQFAACQQFPWSRWAHLGVFYGFLGLLSLSAAAALSLALGAHYPFPAAHPLKLAGNVAAAALAAGAGYFVVQRLRAPGNRDANSWFDWALLLELLLVALTGVLAELFRYAGASAWAYPAYFLHLALVLVLLVTAATSKMAHIFYRAAALTAQRYKSIPAAPPRRAQRPGTLP